MGAYSNDYATSGRAHRTAGAFPHHPIAHPSAHLRRPIANVFGNHNGISVSTMRVCFLHNHDQIHQIAHSLPVALALAAGGGIEVILASASEHIEQEIKRLAGPAGLAKVRLHRLDLVHGASRLLSGTLDRIIPMRKLLILRDNLDFFRSLDVLVVTERTSLLLKSRYGLDRPKMILVDHGAGDRAIGFGPSLVQYDHILAAGPKIRDRMIAHAGVTPSKISITGYPKFDLYPVENLRLPLLSNGRPTVLYNPHPAPHLSSWYKFGQDVLEFFRSSDRYNLIFAPHIMLFQRKVAITVDPPGVAWVRSVPREVYAAPNIHIDLGSHFSTDMSYTRAADIYLGDVSSQVYEFLRKPKPCLFLNAHGLAPVDDPNFAHWGAGEVLTDVRELGAALARAPAAHVERYRNSQKKLFDYTFDLQPIPSAERAAAEIRRLAE